MKIIGLTENGFILEAHKSEVANLAGYFSEYEDKQKRLRVGDIVHVAAMFRHLYELGNAKAEIRTVAAKLRTAADLIDTLPNPITRATAETDAQAIERSAGIPQPQPEVLP